MAQKTFQIVVGFDFTEQAILAVDEALALTRVHPSAVVHVLGVLDPGIGLGSFGSAGKVDFAAAEQAMAAIDKQVQERVASTGMEGVQYYVHTRIGRPAKELIALTDETGADLLIVGTNGRKGVERLVMGSVAEKVVRNGTCPVLVMRPNNHPVEQVEESLRPEPPCPMCVKARLDSEGKQWWCEDHSKKHAVPHPVSRATGPAPGLADSWSRYNH